jgi:CRP/FNR family cyclic AMP-dependent transcriptional regulator
MIDIHGRYGISPDHPSVVEALQHIKMVKYKKGEMILRPYDMPEYIYAIDTGLIKTCTINKKGEESINLIYGPGELFPLGWIIKQTKRDAYFVALTDCEIGLLPRGVFLRLIDESPDVAKVILNKVIELFVAYGARVTNLEYRYGRERVAYRLLMLAGRFGERTDGHFVIPHISQQDLGATMNMTRESVNREIMRFEKLGYIDYGRNGITILNPDMLHKEIGEEESIVFFDQDPEVTAPS